MRRTSVTALTVTCAVALLVVSVIALMLGTAHIPWREVCSIIWAELSGGTVTAVELPNYRIIIDSRLPRVLLAIVIGAGLSAVGLVVQAMVRNALADPYVLGISSGASVGATLVVLFGAFGALGIYALSTAAFAGALAATFLV